MTEDERRAGGDELDRRQAAPIAAEDSPPELSVSIVLYRPDLDTLRTTCRSLVIALRAAQQMGSLGPAAIDIVDNGPGLASLDPDAPLDRTLDDELDGHEHITWRLLRGHGNVGYGRGHNLSISASRARYHLILNPDVRLEPSAIREAIRFLEANTDVGLLTPETRGPNGERQFLCRTRPSVLTLFLRGFAPETVRRLFARRLAHYEMRDHPPTGVTRNISIASGCFMLARRSVLATVGGFHPGYFLYFEDYDLSLEIGKHADIAYVDSVRIVHWGGGVPTKGLRHIRSYLRSAVLFFSRQGWRVW